MNLRFDQQKFRAKRSSATLPKLSDNRFSTSQKQYASAVSTQISSNEEGRA